ncbi:hypothetical protein A9Q87_04205 [Flavobacteriales bacterium 34_180_T64]|nr:hypothetical protein A9Q87_04205 [Flavobacteriales bacterium 34_180_T64]
MKKILIILIAILSFNSYAQSKTELLKHFEAYYQQMKNQGDMQGIINAMTHLDVLEPTQARKDTLAYVYLSEGRNLEALNTIGIESNATDSDINVEVKAIALKALNQPDRSLVHYNELFKRQPNAYLAYEIAELNIQLSDLAGAKTSVEYGLANVTTDMKRTFYETQQPYQTSLKAALLYLKALVHFNENKETNKESALVILSHALVEDPNFNMARVTKEALLAIKKTE